MKNLFPYQSPDFQKLVRYGFKPHGDRYLYATAIMDGAFELRVEISASGNTVTQIIDTNTNEPYTLHLVAEADGAFVGAVRSEFERVLGDVAKACFETDVYQTDCAREVIKYVLQTYGDELQFLWKKSPTSSVWRRRDNGKWYAVIMIIAKRKLGLDSDESVPVLDLRIDPKTLPLIVDGARYFAGYHMNKKSWFTVCLDGSVPVQTICDWIDKSYRLAAKK